MSQVRQNFHEECEQAVNKQINFEMHASYVYLSMAGHFNRSDIALPGFYKYFLRQSHEERGHAEKLMLYQNGRGGRLVLQDIKVPSTLEWASGSAAMNDALTLEKKVNESLISLAYLAEKHNDPQLSDFIEEHFLEDQVKSIKELADHIAQLERVGPGLGEFQYDALVMQNDSNKTVPLDA